MKFYFVLVEQQQQPTPPLSFAPVIKSPRVLSVEVTLTVNLISQRVQTFLFWEWNPLICTTLPTPLAPAKFLHTPTSNHSRDFITDCSTRSIRTVLPASTSYRRGKKPNLFAALAQSRTYFRNEITEKQLQQSSDSECGQEHGPGTELGTIGSPDGGQVQLRDLLIVTCYGECWRGLGTRTRCLPF